MRCPWLDRLSDTSGQVGIIFAFSVLPMIALIGLGIDVSRVLSVRTSLDAGADSAALSAVTLAQSILQSPSGSGASGIATAQYGGQLAGERIFAVNVKKISPSIGGTPASSVTVHPPTSQSITAEASYSASIPSIFGRMFGVNSYPISGTAKSSLKMPSYLNISIAVDVSQSMGLASTPAYMNQLRTLTGGCAFGCHVAQYQGQTPFEQVAHNNGIQLRIDVIRQATQNMIQTAQNLQGTSGLISFALYTMQAGAPDDADMGSVGGQALKTLSTSSTDYGALITAANGIDLGPNDSSGIGDTHFDSSMPALTNSVPNSGAGTDAGSARQYLFIMTDGVQDFRGGGPQCANNGYGHCTQPFNPAQCAALKAKGVTVGVIYTTYLSMPSDQAYVDLVQPFASQLSPNLQACASPGWFYEASDATDIQSAINALFSKATSRGILTQ